MGIPLYGDFSQVTLQDPGAVLLPEIFPQSLLVPGRGPAMAV